MVPYTKFNKYCWYNLAKFKSLAWLWFLNLTPWINGLVSPLGHHQTIIETNRSTWSTRAVSSLGSIGWLALFALFVIIKYRIITIIHLGSTSWSVPLRGGIKNVFFYFRSKRGGGSRPIQKILIRKYSNFFDQRGSMTNTSEKYERTQQGNLLGLT